MSRRSTGRSVLVIGATLGVAVAVAGGVAAAVGAGGSASSVYSSITPVEPVNHVSVAANTKLTKQVAGTGSVPSTATSVAISVTVEGGSVSGYFYGYAAGAARPPSAIVRWTRGQRVTTSTTVAVGTGGDITFANATGSVVLSVEIIGYYVPAAAGPAAFASLQQYLPQLTPTVEKVTSVTLPPGNYDLQATFDADGPTSGDQITCELQNDANDFSVLADAEADIIVANPGVDYGDADLAMVSLVPLSAGGEVELLCSNTTGDLTSGEGSLIATAVGTASGSTEGF